MSNPADRLAAIVALGAVMPDAPDAAAFWGNIVAGKSSISEVPADRWCAQRYYDPDPRAPDKTYSKIGGWVRDFEWNPLGWKLPIPPRVSDAMDLTQRLAIAAARQALADYARPLDNERTAVILGNAMGGDAHLLSAARILVPEFSVELEQGASFKQLPADVQRAVLADFRAGVRRRVPEITEDTMPGELSNVAAGRIAALYDFKGPNFITDAACASAMAALSAAVQGLIEKDYDAVLTGGVDSNMSPSGFVKFSKIGALSATGSRPYAEGADGFVMGEGAVCFVLKRLSDAERDGDRIYAVIRGIGASSDGRGKGITAPNPVGQRLAVQRAWQHAGIRPQAGDLVEGHGTSTKVGDVVEVTSLSEVLLGAQVPAQSIALGSVKSNIGHLKGAAGAAGILKSALALHHRLVPPSINFQTPNPDIDFRHSPFYVNTETREWLKNGTSDGVRRAGVSSFGFGGTNFHVVLEQHVPGMHRNVVVGGGLGAEHHTVAGQPKAPLRGALVLGGKTDADVVARLRDVHARALRGDAPEPAAPAKADLDAAVRLAIDYGSADELADLAGRSIEAFQASDAGRWRALRNKGVYLGRGPTGKLAFLFTGQGSQYVNMLRELSGSEPIVAQTFAEADAVMEPLIGARLTQHIFLDRSDDVAMARAEDALKQTAITQPAVLTVETALARLLAAYGVKPDMVMGHSLGEYGALIAAGALSFGDALRAVSARGEAMAHLALADQGTMAAVFGPLDRVQETIAAVDGYVVIANLNSTKECVIGGATDAMQRAIEALKAANIRVQQLSVSHAFHTDIVAPAAEPLRQVLRTLPMREPHTPIVANVTGDFYPAMDGDAADRIIDMLGRQVGSAVQFVKGVDTLYQAGARVFLEVGPKRALFGMVEDVLDDSDQAIALYTNHPRLGDIVSFNRGLCGLYALGLGAGTSAAVSNVSTAVPAIATLAPAQKPAAEPLPRSAPVSNPSDDKYVTLGKLFTEFLDKSFDIYSGGGRGGAAPLPLRVGITGASVGLPGMERLFDDHNIARLFAGEQLIRPISQSLREAMASRGIVRLVKGAGGEASFDVINDTA
ncbi:MAG TPA: type I polyketide synthase, partial [Longimicrobiales bacterium]